MTPLEIAARLRSLSNIKTPLRYALGALTAAERELLRTAADELERLDTEAQKHRNNQE